MGIGWVANADGPVSTGEPMPDDSAKPFTLKPLVGQITDAGAKKSQEMMNKAGSAPTVEVMVK